MHPALSRVGDELAERDIQSRERENDEANRRRPVDKPLEAGKAYHYTAGSTVRHANSGLNKIKHHDERKHAQYGAPADQRQEDPSETAPITTGVVSSVQAFSSGILHVPEIRLCWLRSCCSFTDSAVGLIC